MDTVVLIAIVLSLQVTWFAYRDWRDNRKRRRR